MQPRPGPTRRTPLDLKVSPCQNPAPEPASAYRATLNMPTRPFLMRGDLPKREPGWVQDWNEGGLYASLRDARRGARRFILHDGPPYANGQIHIGTR